MALRKIFLPNRQYEANVSAQFAQTAGCGRRLRHKKKNRKRFCTDGFDMVVEYSSTANTHPEGVRLVVLKTPPE
jgi:hypothetical protein